MTGVAAPTSDRERSLAVFPAGSNGEFGLPPELVTVIERGEGCRLWDTEGHEWLDFSMGWGSVLPGHAHPDIVKAVQSTAPNGTNFAYPSAKALALAEELVSLSPACDQVRFCASGTEATMYCIRLALAASGRDHVLRFEGAYHGAHDVGVTSLFPSGETELPSPDPSSAGVDASRVLVAPYNDLDATAAIISEHASKLGAIIIEPFQRCLSPIRGFLEGLREHATRHGIPLIFDEVVTGFRLAYGGAQSRYGVVPDLVAYGKALGGGLPIGAFGGAIRFMQLLEEQRLGGPDYVWSASSLGGNPVSATAALSSLNLYKSPGVYARLSDLGAYFRDRLSRALVDCQEKVTVLGEGPLAMVVWAEGPVRNYRDMLAADRSRAGAIMLELVRSRCFVNPMGTKFYLSLAHDGSSCDAFVDAYVRAVLSTRD